jgi:hypothetical protein
MTAEVIFPDYCWSSMLRQDLTDMAEAESATYPQPAAGPTRPAAAPSSGPQVGLRQSQHTRC